MKVYCTSEFIYEFNKIIKKNNYKDLEELFYDFFFNNDFDTIATGDRLYGPNEIPFIKKRIPDAGGYRFYFLADTVKKNIYISFLHPKKEPLGYPNIGSNKKKELHDSILVFRNQFQELHSIKKCPNKGVIMFEQLQSLSA